MVPDLAISNFQVCKSNCLIRIQLFLGHHKDISRHDRTDRSEEITRQGNMQSPHDDEEDNNEGAEMSPGINGRKYKQCCLQTLDKNICLLFPTPTSV